MIKLLAIIVLVMIASLSIAGCTSSTNSNQTASSAPQATTATTGKQILVAQGQQFSIALPLNQTTGYSWLPTYNASAISQKSGSGSGGTAVFTFQALRVGTTSITFDYVRPPARSPSNETSYTVIVR
jgi:predicted secreted protein